MHVAKISNRDILIKSSYDWLNHLEKHLSYTVSNLLCQNIYNIYNTPKKEWIKIMSLIIEAGFVFFAVALIQEFRTDALWLYLFLCKWNIYIYFFSLRYDFYAMIFREGIFVGLYS